MSGSRLSTSTECRDMMAIQAQPDGLLEAENCARPGELMCLRTATRRNRMAADVSLEKQCRSTDILSV
jgi:hypothetical protein